MTLSAHLATSAIGSVAVPFPHAHHLGDPRQDGTLAQAATVGQVVRTGPGHIGQAGEAHDPSAAAGFGDSHHGDQSGLPGSVPGFDSSDPDHRSQGTGPLSGLGMGGGMNSVPGEGQHDPDSTGHDAGPSGLSGIGNSPSAHDLPGGFSASGPGPSDHMPGGPLGGFDNHGHIGHGPEGTTTHQSSSEYVPGAGMAEPVEHSDEGPPSVEAQAEMRDAADEAAAHELGTAIGGAVESAGTVLTTVDPQDHPSTDAGHDEGRPAPDDDHGGGDAGMPAPDDDSSPHNPAAGSAMPAPDDDGSGTSSGSVLHNPAAFGAMPSPDDDGTGPHNPAALSALPAPDDNNPGGPAGLAAAHMSHGATFWDSAAHAVAEDAHDAGASNLVPASSHVAVEAEDHGRTATGLSMTDLAHGSDAGFDHDGFESHADLGASHAVVGDHASWAASDLNPQPIPPEAHGHGFEALQIH